jgi:predicted nucleotidyltransferase
MMSKQDRRIFHEFTARIRQRFPDARIWAFGSRARGVATWDSDFDVCIVLDRLEVGFQNECVITTVAFDADQFENGPMSESTLVANIIREGLAA